MTRSKDDGGLGFRDLHIFNMAMLERQSWRLLQNPDSLWSEVLKAVYFLNTSILEACNLLNLEKYIERNDSFKGGGYLAHRLG